MQMRNSNKTQKIIKTNGYNRHITNKPPNTPSEETIIPLPTVPIPQTDKPTLTKSISQPKILVQKETQESIAEVGREKNSY